MKEEIKPIDLTAQEVSGILNNRITCIYSSNGLQAVNKNPDKSKFVKIFRAYPEGPPFFIFKDGTRNYDVWNLDHAEGNILWGRETWNDSRSPIKPWAGYAFMPKSACRIFLKITAIHPERLQTALKEEPKEWIMSERWKRNQWIFVMDVKTIDPKKYAAENKEFSKWAQKGGLSF